MMTQIHHFQTKARAGKDIKDCTKILAEKIPKAIVLATPIVQEMIHMLRTIVPFCNINKNNGTMMERAQAS